MSTRPWNWTDPASAAWEPIESSAMGGGVIGPLTFGPTSCSSLTGETGYEMGKS
jgi:hypothetical protein